jgi:hypothetical protein
VLVVVEEELLPSVVEDRPLNSIYILSVIIASDVDLVLIVIIEGRGSTTLLLLLLLLSSLEEAANADGDTGTIVAVAAATVIVRKVRRPSREVDDETNLGRSITSLFINFVAAVITTTPLFSPAKS